MVHTTATIEARSIEIELIATSFSGGFGGSAAPIEEVVAQNCKAPVKFGDAGRKKALGMSSLGSGSGCGQVFCLLVAADESGRDHIAGDVQGGRKNVGNGVDSHQQPNPLRRNSHGRH